MKGQTYPRTQHIVAGGGATDRTAVIFKKPCGGLIWMSEPGNGRSDAINKGWRRAE